MQARTQGWVPSGKGWPVPTGEKLERALVAGLMLETVLETPGLPEDPRTRRRFVKSRLTHSLVAHLAGRITLDRFRTLIHRLEQWFPLYYPLMPLPAPPDGRRGGAEEGGQPAAAGDRPQPLVRGQLLKQWLEETGRELLPRRPQRKMQTERLEDFLLRTGGGWFRAKDFAHYFTIDRKTAWEYLQKLHEAALLVHNGASSAAVRYRLADRFLKVKVTDLDRQVALALTELPRLPAGPVSAWLAAGAGEPFWEEHWPERLADKRREEIIASLKSAAVLEVVCRSGRQELLRLQRHWLQE
jgi:hypothetical protein